MLPPKLKDPPLAAAGAGAGVPNGLLADAAEEPNGSFAAVEEEEAPNGLPELEPKGFELLLLVVVLLLLAAPNGLAVEALDANGLPNMLAMLRGLCGHTHAHTLYTPKIHSHTHASLQQDNHQSVEKQPSQSPAQPSSVSQPASLPVSQSASQPVRQHSMNE